MASNSTFRQFVLDLLSIFGLGFGGGQAAASGPIRQLTSDSFAGNQSTPLTPQEAAAAVVKNETTGLDMAQEAAYNGVSGSRFAALVALTGNPPGPETLLTMLNRDIIDLGRMTQGLRQGYLKDEWAAAYEALRFRPLTGPEAVQAAVQGHISQDDAKALWARDGWDPEWFETAFETAGNPPGDQTILTMLNRGIIDQAGAEQALRESRLKDKYIPAYLELARRRIPFRTINTLLRNGSISTEYALTQLEQLGYNEADAQALIKSATTGGTAHAHNETVSQVTALYETHAITQAQAVEHLTKLGYTPDVAAELLQLGDARAVLKLQDQAVTALRSRFVAHRIDEATARTDLLGVGLDEAKIGALLSLWKIEQVANPRELSEAQLRAAVGAKVLTVDDYTARLVAMGYTSEDAAILTRTHFPPTTGA